MIGLSLVMSVALAGGPVGLEDDDEPEQEGPTELERELGEFVPLEPGEPARDWWSMDERARPLGGLGRGLGWIGLGSLGLGTTVGFIAPGADELWAPAVMGGVLSLLLAPPALAASGTRSCRALRGLGGELSCGGATATWTLWTIPVVGLTTVVVAGRGYHGWNRLDAAVVVSSPFLLLGANLAGLLHHRKILSVRSALLPRHEPELDLVVLPRLDPEAPGLALCGSF